MRWTDDERRRMRTKRASAGRSGGRAERVFARGGDASYGRRGGGEREKGGRAVRARLAAAEQRFHCSRRRHRHRPPAVKARGRMRVRARTQ